MNAPEVGELYLADIGIPGKTYERLGIDYQTQFGRDYIVKLQSLKS